MQDHRLGQCFMAWGTVDLNWSYRALQHRRSTMPHPVLSIEMETASTQGGGFLYHVTWIAYVGAMNQAALPALPTACWPMTVCCEQLSARLPST
jgi:hypothetical protein